VAGRRKVSDTLELGQMKAAVAAFRRAIDEADRDQWGASFDNFPRGSCGVTAALLGLYLSRSFGWQPRYVEATRDLPNGKIASHAWLEWEGWIIDITADQDGQAPLIFTRESPYHATWDARFHEPGAFAGPQAWGAFPHRAWGDITKAMESAGFPIANVYQTWSNGHFKGDVENE